MIKGARAHFLLISGRNVLWHPLFLSKFTSNGNIVLSCAKVEERKPGFSSRKEIKLGKWSAVYGGGLFLIDINNETVKEIIHLPSALDSPALFHNQERVLFIRHDDVYGGKTGRELWSVNLDGSNLHKVDLRLSRGIYLK